jgi:hypothetical protein
MSGIFAWRFLIGGLVLASLGLFAIRRARIIARQNQNMIDCGQAVRSWGLFSGPPSTDPSHIRRGGWFMLAAGAFLLLFQLPALFRG